MLFVIFSTKLEPACEQTSERRDERKYIAYMYEYANVYGMITAHVQTALDRHTLTTLLHTQTKLTTEVWRDL